MMFRGSFRSFAAVFEHALISSAMIMSSSLVYCAKYGMQNSLTPQYLVCILVTDLVEVKR